MRTRVQEPSVNYREALEPDRAKEMAKFLSALSNAAKRAKKENRKYSMDAVIKAWANRQAKTYEENNAENAWRYREKHGLLEKEQA